MQKAVLSFAPWGMTSGFWDESGLAGVKIPTFLVVGSKDTTSGYEAGVTAMFDNMTGVDR
jgi:predicted dienelactone hydrolase